MTKPMTRTIGPPFAVIMLACLAAPGRLPGQNVTTPATLTKEQTVYSNDKIAVLINKYSLNDGEQVDYAAWKDSSDDMAVLEDQVALLAVVSPKTHPEQFPDPVARKSYWINTYNTLVLQAVLEYWPLESVRDVNISFSSRVVHGKGFFYDRVIVVGGEETNLYDFEKQVLKQQKDPRLHFVLNCASNSCPALRPTEATEEQLDLAAREFVNDPQNVKVEKHKVYLSRIFKWYKKDFPKEIVHYLQQYAAPELEQQLQAARDDSYKIRYFKYDWDLNGTDSSADG